MQVARAAIREALDAIKGEGMVTDWIDDNHRRRLQGFRQALALLIDEGVLAAPRAAAQRVPATWWKSALWRWARSSR